MFDPPLTSLALVAPSFSSTPIATRVTDSTLLVSSLPLAQCMGLEMGEMFKGAICVLKDDSHSWSKELTLFGPHLEEAPFVEFCGDIVMGSDTHSIAHIEPICSELFNSTPVSSPLLPTTPSDLHAYHESVGDITGCNPSFDPYCAYT